MIQNVQCFNASIGYNQKHLVVLIVCSDKCMKRKKKQSGVVGGGGGGWKEGMGGKGSA